MLPHIDYCGYITLLHKRKFNQLLLFIATIKLYNTTTNYACCIALQTFSVQETLQHYNISMPIITEYHSVSTTVVYHNTVCINIKTLWNTKRTK